MRNINNRNENSGKISMKEKVSKALLKTSIITSVILIIIFVLIKSYEIIYYEIISMKTTLNHTIEGILYHEQIQEEAKELFIHDYVNRANNISAILNLEKYKNITSEYLKEFANFEEVSNIYILNNEGVITQSSNVDAIGIDFYKNPELDSFIPLIESKENGYYCEFLSKSVTTGENVVYLMVRNEEDKLLWIEIKPLALKNYINGSNISIYLESIPMKFNRTLLFMDINTGEILGSTNKNYQTIEGDKLLEKFKSAEKRPKIIKVNDSWRLALSKNVSDNLILVEFYDCFNILINIVLNVIIFSFMIICFNCFNYLFISRIINKLVLNDIFNIQEDLKLFTSGKDIEIRDASTKELSGIIKQLRRIKEGINNSSEQLKLSISILGENFIGYEYYRNYNRIFYVDNFMELTGLTEAEVEEEVKAFFEKNKPDKEEKKYITTISQAKNGKIFRLNRYVTNDSVYAIIEDITEKEKLKKELLVSQEELCIDPLTKLYNRRKIEYVIQEIKNTVSNPKGIMLLMDLDNFKMVNDEKGHIEGDMLLKKFADLLQKNFRDSDYKIRLGGDEFMVFMPSFVPEEKLIQKMEGFLETVRNELHKYYVENHLSVSIGAVYMNSECENFESLYRYADSAMYIAKRSGKDSYYINREYNSCRNKTCIRCKDICEKRKRLFEGD